MRSCRDCGIQITEENIWKSNIRKHNWQCIKCSKTYQQKWYSAHIDECMRRNRARMNNPQARAMDLERQRNRYKTLLTTTINGIYKQWFVPNKRSKPVFCELCGKSNRLLGYHHWDNSKLDRGLWLCLLCHRFAERVDAGLHKTYLQMRDRLEEALE